MIIDLQRFVASERPQWAELEQMLNRLDAETKASLSLEQVRRFHYLYERASADLARITTFASEPETRRYLENLVARAYGEIHETRERNRGASAWRWISRTLPQTFRRHIQAFQLALAITIVGALFGGLALAFDPEAKSVLLPFGHLQGDPAQRVAEEESATRDRLSGHKASFSTLLMTHNTRVSIFSMAMGMTYGIGTIVLLFYNGVILGAVAVDYVAAGQTKFLLGWLLPHGAVEIPAILVASQAGFVLAWALLRRGRRLPLRARLREVGADVVTLIAGAGMLLVWAGFIESFLSQYHEPVLPYWVKILFGTVELVVLFLYLSMAGAATAGSASAGAALDSTPRSA